MRYHEASKKEKKHAGRQVTKTMQSVYTDIEKYMFLREDLKCFLYAMPLLQHLSNNGESLDDALHAYLSHLLSRASHEPENALLYTIFPKDMRSLINYFECTWQEFYDFIVLPVLNSKDVGEMVKIFWTTLDDDLAYYRNINLKHDSLLHQHLRITNNW